MQRFVWDLHYPPLDWMPPSYPIAAIYGNTQRNPLGPWVVPGEYTVKLTVNGRTFTQPLVVKMDPRVKTPAASIAQQHSIAMKCYEGLTQLRDAIAEVRKIRTQLKDVRDRAGQGSLAESIIAMDGHLAALEGAAGGRGSGGRGAGGAGEQTLGRVNGELLSVMNLVEDSDVAPTTQAIAASQEVLSRLEQSLSRWKGIKQDLKGLDEQLRKANLPGIVLN
jgi:hypothetical protein